MTCRPAAAMMQVAQGRRFICTLSRMDDVTLGALRAIRNSGGFYEVAIGSTSAVLGTIAPVGGAWHAAFSLPTEGSPTPGLLGVEASVEGALALFTPPAG